LATANVQPHDARKLCFSKCLKRMTKPDTLQSVEWRDLVTLTAAEKTWELTLSLPWLLASIWCYGQGWWAAGLACSFYFFLTGLRQSHNAQHYALGLPRIVQDVVLFVLSALMLASMHAVQTTHLHHHRHCLDDDDGEGSAARLNWWRALLLGPLFFLRLHVSAWRLAAAPKRRWIAMEVCAVVSLVAAGLFDTMPLAFRWHAAAMLTGECFTAFFAVWTVHHGCDAHEPGRTQNGRWLNLVSYSMFLHAEHHLFPAVPTPHLKQLARRIEAAAPGRIQKEALRFGRAAQRT
jgi:fatty acid desaturase